MLCWGCGKPSAVGASWVSMGSVEQHVPRGRAIGGRIRLVAWWLITLLIAGSATIVTGNDGTSPTEAEQELARKYVAQWIEEWRLQNEATWLKRSVDALPTVSGSSENSTTLPAQLARLHPADKDVAELSVETLLKQIELHRSHLNEARGEVDASIDRLVESWTKAHAELLHDQFRQYEVSVYSGMGSTAISLLNFDRWPLWACGLFAFVWLVLCWLALNRHQLRRKFWLQRSKNVEQLLIAGLLMLVPLVPLFVSYFYGRQVYGARLGGGANGQKSPYETAEQEIATSKDRVAKANFEGQVANLRRELGRLSDGTDPIVQQRRQRDEILRQINVKLDIRGKIAQALQDDAQRLNQVRQDTQRDRANLAEVDRRKRLAGVGLGGGLFLTAGIGAFVLRRHEAKRRRRIADTCPKCRSESSLRPADDLGGLGDVPTSSLSEVQCQQVILQDPFEDCGCRFNVQYRPLPKLGFVTLGEVQSGKTHWMAMLWRQLNIGKGIPPNVHFEKVETAGSEHFKKIVREILDDRMGPAATIHQHLPEPALFRFRDRDSFGSTEVICSLQDFGGTVAQARLTTPGARTSASYYKERALDADGFAFVLDPTKDEETQAEILNLFREELRLAKRIGTNDVIDRPVALCLSKIDLLGSNSRNPRPLQQNIVDDFYAELRKIETECPPMSLQAIRRRSALTKEIADTIWTGWPVEERVKGLFGGRVMFFPMTPVGLNEPGEVDLRKRMIEPTYILEPLLWLLHMNGYPVLDN
jgi:hypothetical protein